MCATLAFASVGLGIKPSLNRCPAASNVTTDSISAWTLTAVPPPVQGVNRHPEHLRQVGDAHQSIKLVCHISPPVPASGDWPGKPPVIARICERLCVLKVDCTSSAFAGRLACPPRSAESPIFETKRCWIGRAGWPRMRTPPVIRVSQHSARIDGRASRLAWGCAEGISAKLLRPWRVPDGRAREMLADYSAIRPGQRPFYLVSPTGFEPALPP
ncbi:MAG: hypothetical protein K0R13_2435 [Propionibacteriaceae bacterium]|nr:hypothetical protein [Propionibacteriaceae bacterium]